MGSSTSSLREREFWLRRYLELKSQYDLEYLRYLIRNRKLCPICNNEWDPPVANRTYLTSKHALTTTHVSARAPVASLPYKGHDQGTNYLINHRVDKVCQPKVNYLPEVALTKSIRESVVYSI